MRSEDQHKECKARTLAPTQSSLFTKVKFQMNDGKMLATVGLFATSAHRKKKSIGQGSHFEAAT